MRIAIINCLKANEVCSGAGCLKALNSRTKHFEQYRDTDIELTAFARCNGCEAGIDNGFKEKLDRIINVGTEVCHVGICTFRKYLGKECPVITQALAYLQEHGIRCVRGTH